MQHLRDVPAQRRIKSYATLSQLPDVLHNALIAEVVRESFHPLRQELDHVRTKASQLLLFISPNKIKRKRERESLSISRQLIPFRTRVFSARLRTLVSFWSAKFCWSMQSRTTWASRACGLMYSLEDSRKAKMYVLSG